MLSLKWKLFRISNYLHIGGAVLLIGMIIREAFKVNFRTIEDIALLSLLLLCILTLIINGIINMVLLEKFYPHTSPGQALTVSAKIFFILSLLILLTGAVLLISGISETIYYLSKQPDKSLILRQLIIHIWILGIISTGVHICWRQPALRKTIRQNHASLLNSFLENENT